MSDDPLRGRVRTWLSAEEQPSLSDVERRRIARTLAEPDKPRRGFALWAIGLAASGLVAYLAFSQFGNGGPTASRDAEVARPVAPPEDPNRPECEGREMSAEVRFLPRADGTSELNLGEVALLALGDGSEAEVVAIEPCRVEVDLRRGRLNVHARDLGGGSLRVTTPSGEVSVQGTVFAVEHDGTDALQVDVLEGHVRIGGCGAPLDGLVGTRVSRRGCGSATRAPLAPADGDKLRAALSLPVAATPARAAGGEPQERAPAATESRVPAEVEDLVMQAEQARRSGDLDQARRLLRRVGATTGAQGEAAWLGLARLEVEARRHAAARDALRERQRRFPRGVLAAEAAWVEVTIEQETGDRERVRELARGIIERWPRSPQATDSQRLLEQPVR